MKVLFSEPELFFPSQAAVFFVSNSRGAVPSPAVRAHHTAPPRAPSSPAADGEFWLPKKTMCTGRWSSRPVANAAKWLVPWGLL